MGKGSFSKVPFSKRICATTMSLVMVAAFAPNVAVAVADTGDGQGTTATSAQSEQDARQPLDLGSCRVSTDKWQYAYTGTTVKPKVKVQYRDATGRMVALSPDTYTVEYQRQDDKTYTFSHIDESELARGGYYRVVVTGKADSGVTGTADDQFKIVDCTNLDYAEMRLSYQHIKTGSPITITPKVYFEVEGDDTAIDPDDYALSYEKWREGEDGADGSWVKISADEVVDVGYYRVVATGKSDKNYSGSIDHSFEVVDGKNLDNGSIDINHETYILKDETIKPKITVKDVDDKTVDAANYVLSYAKWSGEDEDGADIWTPVAADQLNKAGKYRVTAEGNPAKGYSGSAYETFNIADAANLGYGSISVYEDYYYFLGESIVPNVTVEDAEGNTLDAGAYDLSYEKYDGEDEDDADIWSPIEAGQLNAAGKYRVTAIAKSGKGYSGQTEYTNFEILDGRNLNDARVRTGFSYTYDGEAVAPDVSVYFGDYYDDDKITIDSDNYTVSYQKYDGEDWQAVDQINAAGTYRTVVSGRADKGFSGTATSAAFSVYSANDLNHANVEAGSRYFYTGKVIEPKVTVKTVDNKTLDSNKYTVSFEKSVPDGHGGSKWAAAAANQLVDAGEYRITVTGRADAGYSGQRSSGFRIVKNTDLGSADIQNRGRYVYRGTSLVPKLTVIDATGKIISSKNYTLSYEKDNGDDDFEPVNSIDAPGDYRVTATAKSGSGYSGSVWTSLDVENGLDLDNMTLDVKRSYIYTGKVIKPEIELWIYDNGHKSIDPENYVISYEKATYTSGDNARDWNEIPASQIVEPGMYRVVAKGKSEKGYSGEADRTFRIVANTDLGAASLRLAGKDKFTYTGKAISPKVVLMDASEKRVSSDKYTLSYAKYDSATKKYVAIPKENVVDGGSYQITATAVAGSGYTGSQSRTFRIINSKDISEGTIELGKSSYAKTGAAITPELSVYDCDGAIVDSGKYTLSYEKQEERKGASRGFTRIDSSEVVESGEYRVTATAKQGSGYTGTVQDEFEIVEKNSVDSKDLSNGFVYLKSSFVKTGSPIVPDVTLDDANGNSVDSKYYTVSYEKAIGTDSSGNYLYGPTDANEVIDAGKYQVTVTAKPGSGYTGSISREFSVEDPNGTDGSEQTKDFDDCDIYIEDHDYFLETGSPIAPEVVVRDAYGSRVDASKYTLSYEKATGEDASGEDTFTAIKPSEVVGGGTYRVTVTANSGSGYTGSWQGTFEVFGKSQLHTLEIQKDNIAYTGSPIVPTLTVWDGGDDEVAADKYTLSYKVYDEEMEKWSPIDASEVIDPALYRVTATAKDNSGYTGSCYEDFAIDSSADLGAAAIAFPNSKEWGDEATFLSTGEPQKIVPIVTDVNGKTVDAKNYVCTFWTNGESVKPDELSKPGYYIVEIRAKSGSGYTGMTAGSFRIVDVHDLAFASTSIKNGKVVLEDASGAEIDKTKYDLSLAYYDQSKHEYVSVDKLGSDGDYRVTAKAKDGKGLTGTITRYLHLSTQKQNAAAAKAVDDEIAALGKVTLDSRAAVEKARADYNALTDAQKGLVTKLPALEGAEKAIAELQKAQEQKPDPGKSDTGKTEPGKADPGKAEPGKTEPGKSDAGKTDTGKGDSGKAKPAKKPAKAKTSATVNVKKLTAKSLKKALGKSAKTVKSVTLGGKVTSVSSGAFKGLPKLTKVTLGGKVKKISKNAFKGSKVKMLVVKTKKLTKKSVKGALKGSKVATVQVKVGSKKANKKQAKKYRKIFTKKIAGKKVKVK